MTAAQRAAVWAALRARARPLVVWWVFLVLMFGAFCAAALFDDPGPDSLVALGILAAITFPCALLGQVLALLRLRDWVLAAIWAGCAVAAAALGLGTAVAAGPAGAPLVVFLALLLFLGPMFLIGGAWSVQSGRALFGAWVPLVYASGTAIVMAESSGRVAEWHAGAKWAIWDLFTFSVLAASIVLFLAYLAAREAHRLHVWRGAPGGPLQGSVVEDGAARPRLTLGGWALVLVLAGGLSVGTAALAPYLWRTAPADDGGGSSGGGGAGGSGSAGSGSGGPGPGSGGGDGLRRRGRTERPMGTPTEEMQRNLQPLRSAGVDPLATLVTLLILGLLGLLLGGPPARRLLLERRLRAPPWSVPPARRVQELWALVALVLADLGVPAREGEPAEAHVARARAALGALPSTDAEIAGLAEAAAIADRVRFGLGMAPGDVGAMERAACWAADTAWERLGERAQLRALYRWG